MVRLLRNHLYPTYQLYAVMDSSKLTPLDGLKLGALTVLSWLRLRLGGDIPLALQTPEPEAYADFAVTDLCSAHLNYGFVIDIISLPEKGMWTMQITEPDLGSDPGNPQQQRKPVAGRIIETNVANQYKLPGYCTKGGTVVNRAMDYYLKAGNKTEHLVRIYFFFDDERQQIVVGALPEHLDTVRF